MAELHELIEKIENPELRAQIAEAAKRALKQKKFGLVFEEHLPECTPLYDIPVRKGAKVSVRNGKANETYTVLKIEDGVATCLPKNSKEAVQLAETDLVTTAELGDPIYPCLQPLGEVCNAPDSGLWHTLIEADNYHALQMLEYLYAGMVDCIYIDPPYNSGARDWKYNNDYVDGTDEYRHSKWLSFMQKRLEIAKRLLNPKDSVLIITIDEKEYLHLGCLLEEMFPEANIQMVSSNISRKGAARMNSFTRVNEFIYFVMIGDCSLEPLDDADYAKKGEAIHWQSFRRSSASNIRTSRPFQFYPIYVDIESHKVVKVGDAIPHEMDRFSVDQIEGCVAVFPVRDDGTEMMWGVTPEECRIRAKQGYIKAAKYTPNKPQQFVMQYLMSGTIQDIVDGKIVVTGYAPDGSVEAENIENRNIMPKSQWAFAAHDARDFGSKILKAIIGDRFDFPKSLYAVHDCLRYFVINKPNALIVDFFAGSGTTLHAVNLLNAADGGKRRCIMVTNNEVSESEKKDFEARNIQPGTDEWDCHGIARYVTWPRTVCSITGFDLDGKKLLGDYGVEVEVYRKDEDHDLISIETGRISKGVIYKKNKQQIYPELAKIKMADGFKANAAFFKLGFLDKTKVSLGMQFKELLSTLWMKAGAIGKCPTIDESIPDILILPENKMAILNDENRFGEFVEQLAQYPEIDVVYLVTDYESSFVAMTQVLEEKKTYQLYRDYLDNFRINAGRNGR